MAIDHTNIVKENRETNCIKCNEIDWTITYRPSSTYYGLGIGTKAGEHMVYQCGRCGYRKFTLPNDLHERSASRTNETEEEEHEVTNGFWFCYYSDYSGFAAFAGKVVAMEYALQNNMQCEFRTWGPLR